MTGLQLKIPNYTMPCNRCKYLRPAFFLLFANINHQTADEQEKLIKIASSLEVLHMATLIHDDIIDDSPKRRGAVSVQAAFGKDTAVYTGDFLFTIFFDLLVEAMTGSPYLSIITRLLSQCKRQNSRHL